MLVARCTCRTLSLALLLAACGTSEPSPDEVVQAPSEGASPAPEATPSEPSEPPVPSEVPPVREVTARPPVDLLHAVPASVAVSSAYRDSADQVARLVDGDLDSAWNSRTGELEGAWIEFRVPEAATVSAIRMTAGFTRVTDRSDLFTGNHRIARVRVTHGGETIAEAPLDPDNRSLQTIPVEGGGGDYRVELVELVPGSRDDWRETCVSEFRVMGRAPATRVGDYTPRTAVGTLPELGPALPELTDEEVDARLDAVIEQLALVYVEQAEGPGLAMDESGGVHAIPGVRSFARDPDGWVWSCVADGPPTLRGPEGAHPLPAGASCGPLAAGAELRAWVLSGGSLHAFDDGAWSVVPSHGVAGANAIAVDGEGALWVVGPESVARRRGQAFEPVPIRGSVSRMSRVHAAGEHVVVLHAGGLLRLEGDALVPVVVTGSNGPVRGFGATALAPDGTLIAIHEFSGSMYVARPGAPTLRVAVDTIEGRPLSVRAVTFDNSGRLWMWADSGLTILGPTDFTRVVRRYAPGTLPDLTGRSLGGRVTGWVSGLWVERDGPALPRPETPAGRVHGRLVRGGAPLAGQTLLFCTDPIRGNIGSGYSDPCERSAESEFGYVRHVRTRPDGTFDFWDAPQDTVHLVALRSDRAGWFYSGARACCNQLREGRTVDMGDVEVP